MRLRPSLVIIEKERLLLMRYDYPGGMVYGIPGGNPDAGESITQTLIRELREELQITTAPGKLLLLAETVGPGKPEAHVLHILFEGSITAGLPLLNPVETTAAALEWIPVNELKGLHLYPNLGREISQWYQGQETGPQTGHPVYLGKIFQPWV